MTRNIQQCALENCAVPGFPNLRLSHNILSHKLHGIFQKERHSVRGVLFLSWVSSVSVILGRGRIRETTTYKYSKTLVTLYYKTLASHHEPHPCSSSVFWVHNCGEVQECPNAILREFPLPRNHQHQQYLRHTAGRTTASNALQWRRLVGHSIASVHGRSPIREDAFSSSSPSAPSSRFFIGNKNSGLIHRNPQWMRSCVICRQSTFELTVL